LLMSLNFESLTGFTYRGLAPHKFTPVPGVHPSLQPIAARWAAPAELFVSAKQRRIEDEKTSGSIWCRNDFSFLE
jgi:hypothetical protein